MYNHYEPIKVLLIKKPTFSSGFLFIYAKSDTSMKTVFFVFSILLSFSLSAQKVAHFVNTHGWAMSFYLIDSIHSKVLFTNSPKDKPDNVTLKKIDAPSATLYEFKFSMFHMKTWFAADSLQLEWTNGKRSTRLAPTDKWAYKIDVNEAAKWQVVEPSEAVNFVKTYFLKP
jgi:hypothetical protein